MMMKKVTTLTKTAAEKPKENATTVQTEMIQPSADMDTASSSPSTVIVGFSSLAIAPSKVSISVEAMTEPSSEAWARVEEKVTVPLEQEEVELWNLVLSTAHLQ